MTIQNRVQFSDIVRARVRVVDQRIVHAERGDLGICIDHRAGCLPTIEFMRTGTVYDCHPDELEVIARGVKVTDAVKEALQ